MKKVEAIIRQEKLEELKAALDQSDLISGMTVSQVLGCGNQKGLKEFIRGQEVNVRFVLADEKVDAVIELIVSICRTDEVGDGKIFVYPLEEAIRIRTNERGEAAL